MTYKKRKRLKFKNPKHVIEYRDSGRSLDAHFFEVDQKPTVDLRELDGLFKIWKGKLKGRILPSWKDFELEEFEEWAEHMRLLTAGDGSFGSRITVFAGKRYMSLWGQTTFKGQIASNAPPTEDTVNKITQHIKYLYEPSYAIGVGTIPKLDAPANPALWLELPLSDNGVDIAHFINAAVPLE